MSLFISSYCLVRDQKAVVNNSLAFNPENIVNFADFLKSAYKQGNISYPKFYKMDSLSKLGFLTAELLLKERPVSGRHQPVKTGIVLSNSSSSLDTDLKHQESILDRSNYFPSPAVFVYTLANIVIGEICIRHGIKGENAFLVSRKFDEHLLFEYVQDLFDRGLITSCLTGWVEVLGDRHESLVVLVEKQESVPGEATNGFEPISFTPENLRILYENN
jgi:hypothetical protein